MEGFRPILPATARPVDGGPPHPGRPPAKRRKHGDVACTSCRARKIRCDGVRPVCAGCAKRNLVCKYVSTSADSLAVAELKRQLESAQSDLEKHASVIECLRTLPDQEVMASMQRLRSMPTMSTALSLIQPSKLSASRGVMPPTQSDIEFELNLLHNSVYPPLEPLDASSIDFTSLLPKNTPRSPPIEQRNEISGSAFTVARSSPLHGGTPNHDSSSPRSLQDHRYCDARLNRLQIKFWTGVTIDNEFAARIISHFLTTQYPIFACFDADLFLSDLVGRKLGHCSPFLLSSVMCIACQSYSTLDVLSSTFGVIFTHIAERLWSAERNSDTPANLAALCYLSMVGVMSGKDTLMKQTLQDARDMAMRMNLLDTRPTAQLVQTFQELPTEKFKQLAHASWGTYNWLTYHAIYYPAEPIKFTPMLPTPGETNRQVRRSLWPPHPLPSYTGPTFPSFSKLCVIIQEINSVCNLSDKIPIAQRTSLAFAESMYQKLLAWGDKLQPNILRDKQSSPHVFFFHAIYHCTIMNLFRPLLGVTNELQLHSFKSADSTPTAIFAASLRQLKRIIVMYSNTPELAENGWFNAAIVQVSSLLLKNTANDPYWRFYFQLCFSYWKRAYVCYPVFLSIVRANLSYALGLGAINSTEAIELMDELRAAGQHHRTPEEATNTAIFDFDLAIKDSNLRHAKMDALSSRFEDEVMFNQFTAAGDVEMAVPPQPD